MFQTNRQTAVRFSLFDPLKTEMRAQTRPSTGGSSHPSPVVLLQFVLWERKLSEDVLGKVLRTENVKTNVTPHSGT